MKLLVLQFKGMLKGWRPNSPRTKVFVVDLLTPSNLFRNCVYSFNFATIPKIGVSIKVGTPDLGTI